MAEVEEEGENVIVEDEEDTNIDLDSEEEESDWDYDDDEDGNENMYDSPLDAINEVIHFSNQLNSLQVAGGAEMYNFLMQ